MIVQPGYAVARKFSVTIAGHETSIRIEPAFWEALCAAAHAKHIPVNALIAAIDAARLVTEPAPNLASAIRQWVLAAAYSSAASPHDQD
jgi:predicted DNA-binding ribbon-helix-helix protein